MKILKWGIVLVIYLVANTNCFCQNKMTTLVLIDESDSLSRVTRSYLLPYLDHFGVIYETADINSKKLSRRASDYSLIIIGHDMKIPERTLKQINKIRSKGAGVVSFAPGWQQNSSNKPEEGNGKLIYFNTGHYITALHETTDTIKSSIKMPLTKVNSATMKPIVFADGLPLLLVSDNKEQRTVLFTSCEWMKTKYIGPIMGLDDCLWRSFVWAARKPFVMRGLPPLVTMRVDDVAGRGELMQKSPLYWIATANKYGFKPWLGLFIYNLNPATIVELRDYLLNNQATAAPHALGRPNRPRANNASPVSYYGSDFVQTNSLYYYNPDALPLRVKFSDEFIYFDHNNGKPWSDEEAARGLEAVDKWYAANQPLPMSKYFLAHYYEMGSNIIPHVSKNWQMEFIGMNKAINTPYADSVLWLKAAPFRLNEKPGTVTNNGRLRGLKAVYYSDFVNISGHSFFNSLTEIRDDAGYEWAPDNQTETSAARGVRQLKRALSSMALAVLFTHETDFIYKIKPESWELQLQIISDGIKLYNPIMLTMDDALKIVRAHKTSSLKSSEIQKDGKRIKIELAGKSDTESYAWIFNETGGLVSQKLIKISPFSGSISIEVQN